MKLLVISFVILTVRGENFENVDFNEVPEEKFLEAICRSFHKQNYSSELACDDDICKFEKWNFNFTEYEILQNETFLTPPELICKEADMINFRLHSKDDMAYFFQIRHINKDLQTVSAVTTCNYYTVNNLTEKSNYSIRLWAVSYSEKIISYSSLVLIETPKEDLFPSPVKDIHLRNISCEETSCEALIEWNPNEDFSCQYDLVWPKDGSIIEDRVSVISGTHQVILSDLSFGTNYSVDIITRSETSPHEGPKKSFHFLTPTCLDIFSNLEKCRPEIPKNLLINEILSDSMEGNFRYNVHVSWQKPNLLPDYYIAHFTNLSIKNRTDMFINVTGSETEAVFTNVELGEFYHISLMACSPVGCSEKIADERHRTGLSDIILSSNQHWRLIIIVLLPLIAVLMGLFIINHYRLKKKRREERENYFKSLDEEKIPESAENLEINLIKHDTSDHWELNPSKLYFQSVIGEGAFGVVRKAFLEVKNHTKIQVAVKMLKESPTSEDIRQFTQEINIMKSVRQHPYIVSLIGCITEGRTDGPLLVVEYCSRGDLQTYLRNAWDKFCNIQQEIIYSDESFSGNRNSFANKAYDLHNMNIGDEFIIQPKHLLSIARQVALGMEHLAKTRVVHRDLAARNVLVCENHTVKVSDFGLSRDVYRDNVYCKSGGGKLPIRWMALESLTHQRYTTHSDVWSFGVLLWEIVTLGGTPYVGIHTSDLLEFLKSGNRLACPSNCSPELYSLMLDCWRASPKNRPTFTEICKSLEDLLENVSQYLKLENSDISSNCEDKNFTTNILNQSISSSERYVKPVNTFR